MSNLNKFVEWLSFNPTYEQIAQALVLEYFEDTYVSRIRFGKTNHDDSAVILGQFGFQGETIPVETAIPGDVWRTLDSPAIRIITGENPGPWSPDGKFCVIVLRDKGFMQGHSVFEFDHGVPDDEKDCILSRLHDYCMLVSLYISLRQDGALSKGNAIDTTGLPEYSRVGELTSRQIEVLRELVAGKTNLQIARQLGYSHSTIRQETMKIYQALAVKDRRAAAMKASNLNLIKA